MDSRCFVSSCFLCVVYCLNNTEKHTVHDIYGFCPSLNNQANLYPEWHYWEAALRRGSITSVVLNSIILSAMGLILCSSWCHLVPQCRNNCHYSLLYDMPGSNPNMAHSDNLGAQVAIPATLSLSTHNCDHSPRLLRTVIFAPDHPYYPPKQPHLSGSSREPGRQVGSGFGHYGRDSWYLEVEQSTVCVSRPRDRTQNLPTHISFVPPRSCHIW